MNRSTFAMTRPQTLGPSWATGMCTTLFFAAVCLAPGCGGNEPPPEVPSAAVERENDEDSVSEIGATAEIGALPEDETVAAFSNSLDPIQDCFTNGARRIEFLSGEIAFNVVVGQQGKVETIFAEKSTLGDRQTEQCMFGVLRGADWPRPVGGLIGIAQNGFEFEMPGDVRPPVDLSNFDADKVLADISGEIRGCKRGISDRFTATVYIDTNGEPISVGIAAPDKSAETASDCLVDALKSAKFPSPGSWPGKATFSL
jgi:hypothetical protein